MFFGRGKNKVPSAYTFKDMYKEYIKDKEGPYAIPYSDFVDICEEFYKGISEYILDGGMYILPYKLGTLSVIKKKPAKMSKIATPVNWVETNKLGKQVLETNDHSNYYRFQFKWTKLQASYVKNINMYQLIFTRANKRKLASIIKSGEYSYFEEEKKKLK